jgi:hypothetical protein
MHSVEAVPASASWVQRLWLNPQARAIGAPTAVVGLAYVLVLALYPLLHHYTSPLDFAHIGTFFCCHTSSGYGYDGQFYYYIAADPLHAMRDMVPIDVSHRYQRIFYPLVVWLLSFGGQPALVPWMLLAVNTLGTLAGTTALAALLSRRGLSPWFSLAFGLYFGQFAAITHDVPDSLAAALVVLAALALDQQRWKTACFWLAAAALTRELMLVFVAAAALDALVARASEQSAPWLTRLGRAALLLGAALPTLLWYVFLVRVFGKNTSNFSIPTSAGQIHQQVSRIGFLEVAGFNPRFLILCGVLLLPGLVALVWALREVFINRWWVAPGLLLVVLAHVYFFTLQSNTFPSADLISSTRVSVGFPLAWLLYAIARNSRVLLWMAAPWALGVVLFVVAVILGFQSIII